MTERTHVDEDGRLVAAPAPGEPADPVAQRMAMLNGRPCTAFTADSADSSEWHREQGDCDVAPPCSCHAGGRHPPAGAAGLCGHELAPSLRGRPAPRSAAGHPEGEGWGTGLRSLS